MLVDPRALASGGPVPPLLSGLLPTAPRRTAAADPAAPAGAGSAETLTRTLATLSRDEAHHAVLDVVCTQVAAVLGHASAAEVGDQQSFKDLGFDSLTAVELRNRLGTATGALLPATLVFDHPTPLALAEHLCTTLVPGPPVGEAPDPEDEAGVRQALAAIPLERLRAAGLLDALLALAEPHDRAGRPRTRGRRRSRRHRKHGSRRPGAPRLWRSRRLSTVVPTEPHPTKPHPTKPE